jgi:hypothetical protein
MNLGMCEAMSGRLRGRSLTEGLHELGRAVRASVRRPGSLHVVGPQDAPAWHLSAHLDMLARYRDAPELEPVPPHVPVAASTKGSVVLVVSEGRADAALLEQVDLARHRGAVVLGLTGTPDSDLDALAAHSLAVPSEASEVIPGVQFDFEMSTHLFGVFAASKPRRRWWRT